MTSRWRSPCCDDVMSGDYVVATRLTSSWRHTTRPSELTSANISASRDCIQWGFKTLFFVAYHGNWVTTKILNSSRPERCCVKIDPFLQEILKVFPRNFRNKKNIVPYNKNRNFTARNHLRFEKFDGKNGEVFVTTKTGHSFIPVCQQQLVSAVGAGHFRRFTHLHTASTIHRIRIYVATIYE